MEVIERNAKLGMGKLDQDKAGNREGKWRTRRGAAGGEWGKLRVQMRKCNES